MFHVTFERVGTLLSKASEYAAYRKRLKKARTRLEELTRMASVMTLTRVQAAELAWLKEHVPGA